MKNVGREYFRSNISKHITEYHEIACFLHPNLKPLRMYNRQKKEEIFSNARVMMDRMFPISTDTTTTNEHDQRRASCESSNSNASNESTISKAMSMFTNIDSDTDESDGTDEIQAYIDHQGKETDVDVLKWWYINKARYPRLAKLACFLLAIPASSASVERAFSSAGYTVKNRPNLNPSTLDDILVLKSNLDLQ